jgi:hypothetical protein
VECGKGFEADGEVRLVGAHVSGWLVLDGGKYATRAGRRSMPSESESTLVCPGCLRRSLARCRSHPVRWVWVDHETVLNIPAALAGLR